MIRGFSKNKMETNHGDNSKKVYSFKISILNLLENMSIKKKTIKPLLYTFGITIFFSLETFLVSYISIPFKQVK